MKCFIFPLPQVNLFPLTTKPLNIFEPKYIEMVQKSVEQKIPIVLAYIPENGDTYRKIAGFGVPQIVDRRADQTMLIFVPGQGKVRILSEVDQHNQPYIVAECEVVHEIEDLDESLKPKYMALSKLLVSWVQKHIPDPQQREFFIKSLIGPREVIGACAAYLIKDYDLQYEVMEQYSVSAQLQFIYRLFESNELST